MSIFVLVASTHPYFQRALDCDELKEFYGSEAHVNCDENDVSGKTMHHLTKYSNKQSPDQSVTSISIPSHKITNETLPNNTIKYNETMDDSIDTHARVKFLTIMDFFTVAFFLVELIFRFIFCPNKKRFFGSFLNIIDIIALTSECIINLIESFFPQEKYTDVSSLDFIECIQIARVFRLFRLVKNFIGFRVFIYSVRASFKNMVLMVFLMFVAALIFSAVIFYSDRTQFNSIPDAIWWAVVTMTTVGYGDMVPKSLLGKLIGCLCAVTGVFVLAVLIPVLVSNFVLFIGFARIPIRKQRNDLAAMWKEEFVRKDATELQMKKTGSPKIYDSSESP